MDIYRINQKELERINSTIEYLEQQIEAAPEGWLKTTKRNNKVQYGHDTGNHTQYLSAKDEKLLIDLAIKSYNRKILLDFKREKKAIEKYINSHKEPEITEYLLKHEQINRLVLKGNGFISSYSDDNKHAKGIELLADNHWVSQVAKNETAYNQLMDHVYTDVKGDKKWNYEGGTSAPYQEKRTHTTLCGINVRSKSEMIIANELFHANLLFLYEPELMIGDKLYHPDFVIFHPISGEMIIWEHGGMLIDVRYIAKYSNDNSNASWIYSQNFGYKVMNYISAGWIPNINLIITSETAFTPIDTNEINHIINSILS